MIIATFVVVYTATETRAADSSELCAKKHDYSINNPENCQAYWRCQNGVAIASKCPIGFNFNQAAQLCDLPENYPCDDAVPPPQPPAHLCPPTGILTYSLPGSCTKYNFCYGGFHMVRECADNLHFDKAVGQCNYIAKANCHRDVCPSVNDPNNIVVWPSPTDCEA